MPTPFESAQLNLQLFELRRETVLREARDWFLSEFNPESFAELVTLARGERNASFRMVLGYWDMAASLVTTGAIDADAFRAAHGEIFATFSKIYPYLAELRTASGEPDYCKHMVAVVLSAPNVEPILKRRREALNAAAKARQQKNMVTSSLEGFRAAERGGCLDPTDRAAGHSCRSASTGSMREARTAGSSPETMPTTARIPNETSMMVGEARSRMSPSWFAVL